MGYHTGTTESGVEGRDQRGEAEVASPTMDISNVGARFLPVEILHVTLKSVWVKRNLTYIAATSNRASVCKRG